MRSHWRLCGRWIRARRTILAFALALTTQFPLAADCRTLQTDPAPTVLADFDALRDSIRPAVRRTFEALQAGDFRGIDAAPLTTLAELAFHSPSIADEQEVIQALESAAVRAPDPAAAALMRAWAAQLTARRAVGEAESALKSASPDGDWSSAPVAARNDALAPAQKAAATAQKQISRVKVSQDRAILELTAAMTMALIDRLARNDRRVLERLEPLVATPAWSPRAAPILLTAARLTTVIQVEAKRPVAPQIQALETATARVRAIWINHPALTGADTTVAELAADGKLRSAGKAALKRLELAGSASASSPMELTQIATDLDDLPVARKQFLDGMRERARTAQLYSEEWKDTLKATVSFYFPVRSTHRLVVLAWLLDQEDIVPKKSPAWRWAMLALASGYSDAGEPRTATALNKAALASPLPSSAAEILSRGATLEELQKAALEFDPEPDLGSRALMLEAALKRTIERGGPFNGDAFNTLRVLITTKAQIGLASEIGSIVDAFMAAVRRDRLAPREQEKILDSSLSERLTHLALTADELDAVELDTDAEIVRRLAQDLTRSRLRETIASRVQTGDDFSSFGYEIDSAIADFVSADRRRLAFEFLFQDVLFQLLMKQDLRIRENEATRIFETVERALSLVGETVIANHIRWRTNGSPAFFKKLSITTVCQSIRDSVRLALATPDGIANPDLADLLRSVAALNCGQSVEDLTAQASIDANTPRSDWNGEEHRLRQLPQQPRGRSLVALVQSSCALDSRFPRDDLLRRTLLSQLDEAKAARPRNQIYEARVLESLAAAYDAAASDVPISLRQMAMDLLVDEAAAPVGRVVAAAKCLSLDLVAAGRQAEAAAYLTALVDRVRHRSGSDVALSLRTELEKLPVGEIAFGETVKRSSSQSDAKNVISAVRSLPHLSSEQFTKSAWQIANEVRGLPPKALGTREVQAALKTFESTVGHSKHSNRELKAAAAVIRAEAELRSGEVNRALDLIAQASSAARGWESVEALAFRGHLMVLAEFRSGVLEGRGRLTDAKRQLSELTNRAGSSPGTIALQLVEIIRIAVSAHEYSTAVEALKRLVVLKVPFEERDAYLVSREFVAFPKMMAGVCSNALGTWPGAGGASVIAECVPAALKMASIVAQSGLRETLDESLEAEEEVASGDDAAILSLMQDIAPLLQERAHLHQLDLEAMLQWFVAEHTTVIGAAARHAANDIALSIEAKPGALRTWRQARARWLDLEGLYRCSQSAQASDGSVSSRASLAQQARLNAEQAWSDLVSSLPEGKPLPSRSGIDVAALRASLRFDEAILSYTVSGNSIVIWTIRRDSVTFRFGKADDLRKNIDGLTGQIANRWSQGHAFQPLRLTEAKRLYDILVGPAEESLQGVKVLLIEADATIARVPFGALISTQPPSPTWSVDTLWTPDWLSGRYMISFIPSLATVARDRSVGDRPARDVLAAGDPVVADRRSTTTDACSAILGGTSEVANSSSVPGAYEELEATSKLAGARGRLLAREEFTDRQIQQLDMSTFGLIVFATHGVPETANRPARLALSVSSSETTSNPGYITASEVGKLDLNADVVILSACSSGLTSGGRGGLNSLMPAFLRAGAQQVIATAWPIGADTAHAITLPIVRSYLSQGPGRINEAVNDAVGAMIGSNPGNPLRHPRYWAGIFLLGASGRS